MRTVIAVFIVAAVAAVASPGSARVWFVYPDGSGDAMTIQAGIDSCAAGDTVVAMPGIFTGDGNWDIDFKGKPIVVTAAASFDSTITETTTIDCSSPDAHRAFYFHSNEDSTSVLSGFIMQIYTSMHEAIYCDHSSPTISNNRIAPGAGGGIRCQYSSAKIIGNVIARSGGIWLPIECVEGSPYIARNVCGGNNDFMEASSSLYCYNCTSLRVLDNNLDGTWISSCNGIIDGNRINGYGGGLYVINSALIITNNDIHGSCGGGIYCSQSAVTIASNRVHAIGRYAGGISMHESLPSRIVDNDIGPIENDNGYSYGIEYSGDSASVIESNTIHEVVWRGGWGIICHSSVRIAGNLIFSNETMPGFHNGGGILVDASPVIEGNTIVGNVNGDGIWCASGSSAIIRNNVIANNTQSEYGNDGWGIYTESASIVVSCCDIYNHESGNYYGIADQTGLNGNISVDPIFCDAAAHDYSIHEMSPCAPGKHPDGVECGLIGARGVACYYIATLVRSFRAVPEPGAIMVTWEVSDGGDDLRFAVLRSEPPNGEYVEIEDASVAGSGSKYSFRDARCEPGKLYSYRVDVIDETGRRELFETDAVAASWMPLALHQNHPNPFNPSTTIGYYLPEKARIRLEVYDIAGRRIATLDDGERERGAHTATWNGMDKEGTAVASGVYFSRLAAGKETISKKMVLLR